MCSEGLVCPECGSHNIRTKGDRCLCEDCWHTFARPAETDADARAIKPLKLFLSYGHDQNKIVELIKARLESRGHQVWLDASKIKVGDDWREAIAEGILSSNGVIACLSEHAGRPEGVCLDEIDIALNVKGGNILSVLLEPWEKASPPQAIRHIQTLDMAQWKERMAEGEASFAPWFNGRMDELLRALECRDIAEFDSEISFIGERLGIGAKIDNSKQMHLLSLPFVGRGWLCDKVAAWLDDKDSPRICLVTGDAGVGKSAFAAHLAHWQWKIGGRVVASLFCDANHEALSNPRVIMRVLAYLIACRIPQYRALLFEELRAAGDLSDMSEGDLFSCLIGEPLSHTISNDVNMLIVVDGIDEAGDYEENALADTLARYATHLPSWVKLLVTSRRVSPAVAPFGTGSYVLDLKGDSDENEEDVRAYLSEALAGLGDTSGAVANRIAEASAGVFLYATLMVDAVSKGLVTPQEIGDSCPQGLHEAFYQWFRWTFPDFAEYRSDFRGALGCIGAALGDALPVEELGMLFDWDENQVEDFMRRVAVLIRRTQDFFGRPAIAFNHAFIFEWLMSAEAGGYQSSLTAAYRLMGKRYALAIRDEGVDALSDYAALHVLDLLDLAGMKRESEELWIQEGVARRIFDLYVNLDERGTVARAHRVARHLLAIACSHGSGRNGFKANLLHDLANHLVRFAVGVGDEITQAYRESVAVYDQLAETEPAIYLPRAAEARLRLASWLGESGEHEEAEAAYLRAREILLVLARRDPATYIPQAANALQELSGLYRHWKDGPRSDDAQRAVRNAETLLKRLEQTSFNTPEDMQAHAKLLVGKGMLLADKGQYGDAVREYREAFSIYYRLAQYDPPSYLYLLEDAANKLSYLSERLGNREDSLDLQRFMHEFAWSCYRSRKISVRSLSFVLSDYGECLARCGELEAAENVLHSRADIERALERSSQSRQGNNVVEALAALGDVLARAGKYEEAEQAYRDAIDIPRAWAKTDEYSLPFVVWRLEKLGAFLDDVGKHEEAEACRREAQVIKASKDAGFGWIQDPDLHQ